MAPEQDTTGGMGELVDEAARETDAFLADTELKLLTATTANLESLRPQIGDQESFDKLIAAVQEATSKNNDIALLRQRINAFGEGVKKVAERAIGILKQA